MSCSPQHQFPTAVVGATTWGTTLAVLAARGGAQVRLLCRTDAEAKALRRAGEHARRLPGVPFPDTLSVEHDPASALSDTSLAIVAVPSDSFRQSLRRIAPHVPADAVVLSATKGLELPPVCA